MRRLIVLSLIVATVPLTAFSQAPNRPAGQSKCTLTLNQSPNIRGIRLGLSTEQVLAMFPGSGERAEIKDALAAAARDPGYGVARLSFHLSSYPSAAKAAFAGIDSYSVVIFDGRVAELSVWYNAPDSNPRGPSWRSVDDFIAKLAGAYNLPGAKDWEEGSDTKSLKCADFVVVAMTANGTGVVGVRNRTYLDQVRERAAAEEERRRREFKP